MSETKRKRTGKPHQSKVGSAIYDLRMRKNESLAEFAKRCGTNASKLSRLENGRDMSVGEVKRIADSLGVDFDALARNDIPAVIASVKENSVFFSAKNSIDLKKKERGNKGEAYVVALEREAHKGTIYENAVNASYADNREAHFDILSYSKEGVKKYIEVKSTASGEDSDFFMSEEERRFMEKCLANGEIYELHRVYYLNNPEKIGRRIYTAEELLSQFTFSTASYKVRRIAA